MASIIAKLFSDMVTSRYMLGAGLTVMVYDWLLTIADERRYIWKARWSPVKVVFLINRYFMPLTLAFGVYAWSGQATILTKPFCEAYITTDSFILLSFFATLHWLVAMRAWALWGRSRLMGIVIWGIFLAYLSASAYLTGTAMAALHAFPIPGVDVCFGNIPKFLWSIWLPPIIFETIIFCLTGIKALQHYQQKLDTPILSILYRDGILYFIFISMNSFTNLLVWALAPTSLVIVVKFFSTAICEVAGSHLVLDLIEVGVLTGASRSVHSNPPPPPPSLYRSGTGYSVGMRRSGKHDDEFEMMPSPSSPHQAHRGHHNHRWPTPLNWDRVRRDDDELEEENQDGNVSFSVVGDIESYRSETQLLRSEQYQIQSQPDIARPSPTPLSRSHSQRKPVPGWETNTTRSQYSQTGTAMSTSQFDTISRSANGYGQGVATRSIQWFDRRREENQSQQQQSQAQTRTVPPAYAF